MNDYLSTRIKNISESLTLSLVAKALELKKKNKPVISLAIGEPDWTCLDSVKNAAITAIRENKIKYTSANGMIELRKAIANRFEELYGISYNVNEITAGSGAKYILTSAFQTLLNENDEVIFLAPYWLSYPDMIKLTGAKCKIIKNGTFKISPEELKQTINKKTKILLLNSPSNPSGIMYSKDELLSLANELRKHKQVIIVSDEIYNEIIFNKDLSLAHNLVSLAPDLKNRIICINGASKTYAMTGYRIGWALGPIDIIKKMTAYQSQTTGSASQVSQIACIAALEDKSSYIKDINKKLLEKKNTVCAAIKKIHHLAYIEPDGAFYIFLNIKKFLNLRYEKVLIKNSEDFANVLLNEFYVLTLAGSYFGTEGYLRITLATSTEQILESLKRLEKFTKTLKEI
ncbi:MAG: aspartate aminotransferase [Arcobacter sp.]|nr:MAG: aspartate aminotransferase [Arcobacter sp.]